jgi:mono/diheme cytochrome c family protein
MRLIVPALCAAVLMIGCGQSHAAQEEQDDTARAPRDTTNAAAIDSASVTAAEIALGDSVFNGQPRGGMCATCHGPNGAGTQAAPRLNDQQWIHGDGSLGFIEGTIVQGVPQPQQHAFPMPPFGGTLTDRQLHAVAGYVYSLSHPHQSTKR